MGMKQNSLGKRRNVNNSLIFFKTASWGNLEIAGQKKKKKKEIAGQWLKLLRQNKIDDLDLGVTLS